MSITGGIIWIFLSIVGIIWCIVPWIPWPQLAYIGVLVFHFMAGKIFPLWFLIIWGLIVLAIVAIDQILPSYATKKFWGSKYWVRWCIIWTIIGIFWWLIWILLFPFLWAWIGESISKQDFIKSLKPAIGSFIWTAMSWIIKIAICIILWWAIVEKMI